MTRTKSMWPSACALVVAALGCSSPETSTDAGDSGRDGGAPELCQSHEVVCADEMIQQLSLHTQVSSGAVTTTREGDAFVTVVDASAGGMSQATQHPFVYLRFADDGAHKVEIDDETALESQEWDLALRRFVVRLNSGDSGPSCVAAAEVPGDFAEVTGPPDASAFRTDDEFYDESCNYVADTRYSGFDGPNTVIKTYWEMNQMCLAMTGQVYVLRLADGRYLKMTVEAYYRSGQDECNSSGQSGSGSGVLTLRWAWL